VAGARVDNSASTSVRALVAQLAGLVLLAMLLAFVLCSCRPPQHRAAEPTATLPAANIAPLPVRPVQSSQLTAPNKCPATNPNAPVPPDAVLVTCDVARTTLYTLGPQLMQIVLTHVDAPKSLTADFYEVNLIMDQPTATAWASFTAAHLHSHVAFIRDDVVLEAPIIEYHVTSGEVVLTTQTVQAADQLAGMAGRPA
jgi:hypothetical protein